MLKGKWHNFAKKTISVEPESIRTKIEDYRAIANYHMTVDEFLQQVKEMRESLILERKEGHGN